MIEITLEKTIFFVSQPNLLTICLTNTEEATLTNVIFGLTLPGTIIVQSGVKQVSIAQLSPREKYSHTLKIVPKSVGICLVKIVNFSYRDGSGKTQRYPEVSHQITVGEALPLPPQAEIDVKLSPIELSLNEWSRLEGQITNINQIALGNIKIRVTGRVESNEEFFLPRLSAGKTERFSVSVRPLESGIHLPISLEIKYVDQIQRSYSRSISTSLRVINKESGSTTTYNFSGATIGGGVSHGNYKGDVIHHYAPQKNLAEAATEIQQLLDRLSQTYPIDTKSEKMIVAAKAIEEIETNQTLKQRILSALKAGGTSALEQALNHPVASFVINALKDWQENC